MTTYQDRDPRGWCGDPSRGAALGRRTIDDAEASTFDEPLLLKRVPIDRDGYDPNGTYFGTGENLYWLASEDGKIDRVFRAKSDAAAIAQAANWYTLAKIPERVEGLTVEVESVELDSFTQSYLEAALRSSTDDDDRPFDEEHTTDDFSVEALQEAKRECEDFQEAHHEDLALAYEAPNYDEARAGHDFWLTRNRHGAGFWDRGLGDVGRRLTDAAHAYGEVNLYVGDSGKVECD